MPSANRGFISEPRSGNRAVTETFWPIRWKKTPPMASDCFLGTATADGLSHKKTKWDGLVSAIQADAVSYSKLLSPKTFGDVQKELANMA